MDPVTGHPGTTNEVSAHLDEVLTEPSFVPLESGPESGKTMGAKVCRCVMAILSERNEGLALVATILDRE